MDRKTIVLILLLLVSCYAIKQEQYRKEKVMIYCNDKLYNQMLNIYNKKNLLIEARIYDFENNYKGSYMNKYSGRKIIENCYFDANKKKLEVIKYKYNKNLMQTKININILSNSEDITRYYYNAQYKKIGKTFTNNDILTDYSFYITANDDKSDIFEELKKNKYYSITIYTINDYELIEKMEVYNSDGKLIVLDEYFYNEEKQKIRYEATINDKKTVYSYVYEDIETGEMPFNE